MGNHDYNVQLSLNRAKAAYDYLVARGIDDKRMEYKGYGPDVPIASNATAEGRAKTAAPKFSSSANNHQQKKQ